MAPLTVELISENLSSNGDEPFDLQECLQRADIAAIGSFFVGLSAGTAFQVHFRRYIPRSARALFIIPLLSGGFCAKAVRDHFRVQCARDWIASGQTPFNTTEPKEHRQISS